jgi:hypothetical protein
LAALADTAFNYMNFCFFQVFSIFQLLVSRLEAIFGATATVAVTEINTSDKAPFVVLSPSNQANRFAITKSRRWPVARGGCVFVR